MDARPSPMCHVRPEALGMVGRGDGGLERKAEAALSPVSGTDPADIPGGSSSRQEGAAGHRAARQSVHAGGTQGLRCGARSQRPPGSPVIEVRTPLT